MKTVIAELVEVFSTALNILAIAAVVAAIVFHPAAVKAATAQAAHHGFECVVFEHGLYLPCAESKMEVGA